MGHHKHKNLNNRRNFLRKLAGAGCASLTLSPLLSGITNLSLLNAAAAANQPIYTGSNNSDYKALVCIMLSGGNDSFNMLMPYTESQYNEYVALRGGVHSNTNLSGMALERDDINMLDFIDDKGFEYRLHPKMGNIKKLFNGDDKYVSFVANVGTLVEPLENRANYKLSTSKKPKNLFSHSDQMMAWQTGIAGGPLDGTGWAGRAADMLRDCNNTYHNISMNISLNGLNLFQRGRDVTEYVIQSAGNGSIPLIDRFYHEKIKTTPNTNNLYYATRDAAVTNILDTTYQNILEKAYAHTMSNALQNSDEFNLAINSFNINGNTSFEHDFPPSPITGIGDQLKMVAKSIATRNSLAGTGHIKRQTYFVVMGGFDNHSELMENHGNLLQELDEAIYAFYKAMKEIGDEDKVTGFTMSDFARTLGSNGDGTDHAWGGHHLVFGGAIDGGKIFGEYPDLSPTPEVELNIGNGRILPTTSCDEYFADLALWFGASAGNLDTILPNIREFWSPTGTTGPLGLFNNPL